MLSETLPKIDMEDLQEKIVKRLKTLNPQKIILFGSYAYGNANENSDIDLFLVKDDLKIEELTSYELQAMKKLQDLVSRYKIGFDVLSAPTKELQDREDYFYKVDILQKGKVLYAQ
jgi:predicted nucleotidyltransferase